MAWTSPRTWVSGALSAAAMNTDIRDNLNWLKDALTTHGITSDSTPTAIKSARYGVSLRATGVSIPAATDTAVGFSSEGSDEDEWDDDAFHSTSTNNGRVTVPADGTYDCMVHAAFTANSTGRRELWLEVDATTAYVKVADYVTSGSMATYLQTSMRLTLSAGQYVRCMVHQNSGGALDVSARFQVHRVAA